MSNDTRAGSDADAVPARSAGRAAFRFAREVVFVLVGAVVVSSLLRAFVGQMFIIPSPSMESTLLINDRVAVRKVGDFGRGNVVVFQDPANWLHDATTVDGSPREPTPTERVLEFIGIPTATTPGHLIKRVIGLPGDTVVCCDANGRITVNGYSLDERSYLFTDQLGQQVEPSRTRFEVVVPRDRIFVMGDNREVSADSRCHLSDLSTTQSQGQAAFVPMDMVVGPAMGVVAPFNRASRLPIPANFAGIPAPSAPAPAKAVIKPEGVTCS